MTRRAFAILVLPTLFALSAFAQQTGPHLATSSIECGQHLQGATHARCERRFLGRGATQLL